MIGTGPQNTPPPLSILDKLHALEKAGHLASILYLLDGSVCFQFLRPALGKGGVESWDVHPTFEDAIEAEYGRLRLGS